MKIIEYPKMEKVDKSTVVLVDGDNGTKTIPAVNLVSTALTESNVVNKRCFVRGKNLGSVITSEQKQAIQNGSFDNLYLGDYWTNRAGVKFVIIDFNYWSGINGPLYNKNHIVVGVDRVLYAKAMCNPDTTDDGYGKSDLRKEGLVRAENMFKEIFGDSLIAHTELLTTSVDAVTHKPSSYGTFNSLLTIPSEVMLYGHPQHGVYNPAGGTASIPFSNTADPVQLAYYAINPSSLRVGDYWTRDIASKAYYAAVNGVTYVAYARDEHGVRPVGAVG